MSAPNPSPYRPPVDAFARLLNDLMNRLDENARTIADLQRRVLTLEGKPVVVPANPQQIQVRSSEGTVTFTVSNAEFVDFVDLRVNGVGQRCWSPQNTEADKPKFKLEGTTITVGPLAMSAPVRSVEVFTRYDKYTKTSEAGRGIVNM